MEVPEAGNSVSNIYNVLFPMVIKHNNPIYARAAKLHSDNLYVAIATSRLPVIGALYIRIIMKLECSTLVLDLVALVKLPKTIKRYNKLLSEQASS